MTERADTPTAGDDLPRFARALRPLVDVAARLPASVHTKLLGGLIVGVLLLLAMGAVSLLVVNLMSKQVYQLTRVYAADTLVYSMELQVALQSHLRELAILTQEQSYNDAIADSHARFERRLAGMDAVGSPSQVAMLQRVREADQRFAAAGDRVLALYRAGDLDGATRLHVDQEHAISHELEVALQQMETANDDDDDQALRQFDVDRGVLTVMMGAFSGVSLATALLLGFVLSWSLTRPVRRMDRALAHITAGEFGQQVEIVNGDELGTLGRNLNLMSRELERLYAELRGLNESLQEKNEQLGLELAERRRTEAELAVARDQALEANRVKTSFLTNVSAELRTPLNTILGFTESLIEDAETAGQGSALDDLQHIRAAARHLLRIINDILDLSAIEAGRMQLYLEPVSVGQVVADAVAILRPLAQNGGNTLQVDCAADVGIIDADLTRVRQILFNLLNNACKFTQRGSIAVRVARETEDDAHWVTVAVSDTGAGIPPEQLQGLFDSFGQAGDAAMHNQAGPGLGLAMTHRLCQLMGADLTVQSEYGRGSTFTVRLPATAPAAVGAAAIHLASGTSAPDVLVIDDDPVVRERLHVLLAAEGLVAMGAARAEEGVRLADEQRPRAITLDLLMPGGEGWGALAALKSNPALADVPIVMLTLYADRDAGLLLDVADFLTTPFDRSRVATVSGQRPDRPDPPHALVVDADPAVREALRQALESEGWTVTAAASGSAALAALETVAVDRVFAHLAMAEMSGLELVHRLRQEPRWQSIPVVGILAAEPSVQERLRLNQSVAVLDKEDVLAEADLLSRLGDRLSAAIGVARDGAGPLAGSPEASPALAGARPPRRVSGRILIVDDNTVNRTELAVQLEQSGHTTAQAANGREALELLGSGNVDLVLSDVIMPEMDGYELLERRMADPRLGAVPVIMVATANDVRDVARCIELGAEDFLTRPLDPVLLRARVSTCLEKKWLRDQEVEYLQQVGRVTAAAAAVETGTFDAESIADLGKREDALGRLVRVFQQMVQEVYAREQRLREQVRELRIEVDQTKRARQVAEITETDYFRELQQRAQSMRRRDGAPAR